MLSLEENLAMLQDPSTDPSLLSAAVENLHKQIDALAERRTAVVSRKRKWSQRYKTSLPTESLLDALRFLSRNDLDCVQLASKQLSALVSRTESAELALRRISKTTIGKEIRRDTNCEEHRFNWCECAAFWIPASKIEVDATHPKRRFKSPGEMQPFLRMSYVEELELNLEHAYDDDVLRYYKT